MLSDHWNFDQGDLADKIVKQLALTDLSSVGHSQNSQAASKDIASTTQTGILEHLNENGAEELVAKDVEEIDRGGGGVGGGRREEGG